MVRPQNRPDYPPIPQRGADLLTPGVADHSVSLEIDADIAAHSALDTGVHGAGASTLATELDIATHNADYLSHVDKKVYHGIEASGALSFDNSTHILTMASGTNTYWYKGDKYTTAAAITCDLDTYITLTTNTLYYVAFDDATGTLKASESFWDLKTKVPVATVYWNGTAAVVNQETHNYTRDVDWHIWAHLTVGCRYRDGFGLTAPTAVLDNSLDIAIGRLYDEDLLFTTSQQTVMRGWYQVSANVYTFTDYAFPYLGTDGVPYFLDTDDYTLKSYGINDYANFWVYGTTDIDRPIYVIPTQAASAYNLITQARTEKPPALTGLGLTPELKLLYRFIYNGNGSFEEVEDYRNASSLPAGGVASTAASAVSFVPYGTLASTNVQTAISELEDDKTLFLLADGTRELTDDMTVTALKTIDGRDISVDGAKLDTLSSINYDGGGADRTSDNSTLIYDYGGA